MCLDFTQSVLTLLFQAPDTSRDLYRQNLGQLHKKSGNANMPVYSKSEVATILNNLKQEHIVLKLKMEKSVETPDTAAHVKSSKTLKATSVSACSSPASPIQHMKMRKSNVPSGIVGFNFKGHVIDQMTIKNEKVTKDQMNCADTGPLPGTPEAPPRVLVRSSSSPETVTSNDEALPQLNQSSIKDVPGAAIKAALGSGLFASFRRASLAGVLEKVRTHMGEQIAAEKNYDAEDEGKHKPLNTVLSFEEKLQFDDADESVKDPATFAIEHQSNLRKLRLKSMCQDFESDETRQALDRISAADKQNSSSQRIQKVWRFDQIAEVPVRSYTGLKKNADVARRPSSAIGLPRNFGSSMPTPRLDLSASEKSIRGSVEAPGQEKTRISGGLEKVRQRSSMGPGGFWREGLHSASTEALHRKMPYLVASITAIKNSKFTCNVCHCACSQDALGRCAYCGA
jgi:hypothetical protein